MTVRELLARIDSRELSEWLAYYSLQPFGERQADWRAGLAASAALNPWRARGQKALTPLDLVPDYGGLRRPERPAQTAEEQKMAFLQLTAQLGGEIRGNHR